MVDMACSQGGAVMHATIIPGQDKTGKACLATHGTQIEVAPGVYLRGVTRIQLDAQVGGMWTATVECLTHVQPIKARITLQLPKPARYYRRGGRAVGRK